jgi:hypothetical protein
VLIGENQSSFFASVISARTRFPSRVMSESSQNQMLGRVGVNGVYSFFALTPLLIATWHYLLGWLLGRWR